MPEPTTPKIEDVNETMLLFEGEEAPGVRVQGSGFSRDAQVVIDDGDPLVAGDEYVIIGPEEILIARTEALEAQLSGQHSLVIHNPSDIESEPFAFDLP